MALCTTRDMVRHRVTGEVMVLKMNKLMSNRHNMLREVQLMNRLQHPNILSYYGVCVNEGQVHALTEYINGGSLDSLIQDACVSLPWCTRVSLALDVARGMAYLHSQRVFHRDLTSKNVLIKHTPDITEEERQAVVADFGLAAPIPDSTCVRLPQVGSPYWMAPEVIRGTWYDHRVDVFSFGIIVCELIARCEADPDVLPRTHNFGVDYLLFSHMVGVDCPPDFLHLAFRCCQIDPSSRPLFEEITEKLEAIKARLAAAATRTPHRKNKAGHRRSLSDDTFLIIRNQMLEVASSSSHSQSSSASSSSSSSHPPQHHHQQHSGSGGSYLSEGGLVTPLKIGEAMVAADPYYQPSNESVNPFACVKLPARSHFLLEEGGRVCHSLPSDPEALYAHRHPEVPSRLTPQSPPPHHASDSSLCQSPSSPLPATSLRVPPTTCTCIQTDVREERQQQHQQQQQPQQYTKSHRCLHHHHHHHHHQDKSSLDEKRKPLSVTLAGGGIQLEGSRISSWPRDLCQCGEQINEEDEPPAVSNSPRSDTGSSSGSSSTPAGGGGLGPPHVVPLFTTRRRGSGESGFFSVGEADRNSTPELCLSYSELSTASLISTEDEDGNSHYFIKRSSSVITDSSEDLSSLGCDLSQCDLSQCDLTMCDVETSGRMADYVSDRNIHQIVEFFERQGRLVGDSRKTAVMRKRTSNVVPLLTSKFSSCSSSVVSSSCSRPSSSWCGCRGDVTRSATRTQGNFPSFASHNGNCSSSSMAAAALLSHASCLAHTKESYTPKSNPLQLSPLAATLTPSASSSHTASGAASSNSCKGGSSGSGNSSSSSVVGMEGRTEAFRAKERPIVFITEGTVRAKRDIFEAK
ncbi:uncharacterized protein LOC143018900 isoform X2 [Oratosquilla oratoria]|uniref:uncharacterized protein LOC143018900 isoform X2 n=1 Tax=Oratosquilla oratoria TaxID=337810 RepID=UPI003F76225C